MSPEVAREGPGTLVLVVGPSGAGKDTIMRAARDELRGHPSVIFARRVVTRHADGSEDNESMAETAFMEAASRGMFALDWRAHGLAYGVPHQALAGLARGETVVVNGSRSVVALARERFAAVRVVLVTAPPEVLRARILARGRDADAEARLARKGSAEGDFRPDLVIDNSGSLRQAVDRFVGFLTARNAEVAAFSRALPGTQD